MKKEIHDLHFIMCEKLYLSICELAHEMDRSFSSMIVYILEILMPFIEKNGISFQDKESQYQLVGNPEEGRCDSHVYIQEDYYRRLKQLHHDLNVFSLGQIVRKIIEYFLKAYAKYGIKGLLKKLSAIKTKWGKKKEFYKCERKEIRQLSHKNSSPPYLAISYGINSKPFIFKFI